MCKSCKNVIIEDKARWDGALLDVADLFYEAGNYCYSSYGGWMRVDVGDLWELAVQLTTFSPVEIRR